MTRERIHKFLSRAGVASRRAAESMVREGRVTINGRAATIGQSIDPDSDAIKVDERRIVAPDRPVHYYLVHKPVGMITTRSDPEGRPTVMDLLPRGGRARVRPVGRLDADSEGLLVMTDDGALAHRISHPRFGCRKTYQVKVKGVPDASAITRLRGGTVLAGRRRRPVSVERFHPDGARSSRTNSWWTVVLTEGRTRQLRVMFLRIGHPVLRLRRVAIGPVRDRSLRPGGCRRLTASEIARLNPPPKNDTKRKRRGPVGRG